jgi:DNA-binding transcriptional ArsR family regulator
MVSLSITGSPSETLSQHLAHLRTAGLVFSQRRGKEIRCEVADDRVRYEQQGDGGFSVTVTARVAGWR